MARGQSKPLSEASSAGSSFDMAIEKILNAVLVQDAAVGSSVADDAKDKDASSIEIPGDSAHVSSRGHYQLSTPLSSQPDSPLTTQGLANKILPR